MAALDRKHLKKLLRRHGGTIMGSSEIDRLSLSRRSCHGTRLLLALLLTVIAPRAAAEEARPLEQAERAIEALDYAEAARLLEQIAERTEAGARELDLSYEMLGACRLYLGESEAGHAAFRELLRRDPGWTLSTSYPPRVVRAFDSVRAAPPPALRVELEILSAPHEEPEGALIVHVTQGAEAVESVCIVTAGEEVEACSDESAEDRYDIEVPVTLYSRSGDRGFRVEARAPSGSSLTRLEVRIESADAPVVPEPSGDRERDFLAEGTEEQRGLPARRRFYSQWWFWTIIGAVVVGTVVPVAVVASQPEGPREGTAGSWEVWP